MSRECAFRSIEAEEEPFLDKSHKVSQSISQSRRFTKFIVLLHLTLIATYSIIFFVVTTTGPKVSNSLSGVLNLAISDLEIVFKPSLSITAGASPYAGGPSLKIDKEWHDLLGNISIKVSNEELQRNGNHKESVALSKNEDEGHLVWLGVFHQLHCIKQLRQLNYRDHYHPNMTEEEDKSLEVHINHCLEMLRQAVMCNPDTSLTTFVWTDSQTKPVLDIRRFERQCVDWEIFMSSVIPRVVSKEMVDALENPLYNMTKR